MIDSCMLSVLTIRRGKVTRRSISGCVGRARQVRDVERPWQGAYNCFSRKMRVFHISFSVLSPRIFTSGFWCSNYNYQFGAASFKLPLLAMYKSFRIITSGNLRKSLLDAKVWPVGVWVRDYETFSQSRLHKRSNNQGGQFNNQNGS